MPTDAIIIDANLLVLLVVGQVSRDLVGRHKRLRAFTAADHALLVSALSRVSRILVTPNTLTETSNLALQTSEPWRSRIAQALRNLVAADGVEEQFIRSGIAMQQDSFPRLGLTDAALVTIAEENIVLWTADLDLYLEVSRAGKQAVNFYHYIEANRST